MIAAGAAVHYGWSAVPVEHQADVFNAAGAAARAGLLVALMWHWRGPALLAGAWWIAEEAMVIGCSLLYIVAPWDRVVGQAQCSSLLHFDLGKIGALALIVIALGLYGRAVVKT